jgi:hypothetical protein
MVASGLSAAAALSVVTAPYGRYSARGGAYAPPAARATAAAAPAAASHASYAEKPSGRARREIGRAHG